MFFFQRSSQTALLPSNGHLFPVTQINIIVNYSKLKLIVIGFVKKDITFISNNSNNFRWLL